MLFRTAAAPDKEKAHVRRIENSFFVFSNIILRSLKSFVISVSLTIAAAVTFLPERSHAEITDSALELSTPQEIENAFLYALKLMQSGEPRKAVFLLRQILARNPDLPRVRLELARAYYLMESWAESRAEFVAVLSGDIPLPVKQNILRYINSIDARRGFDWRAEIGMSINPETSRRYKSDTVTLDFGGAKIPFTVNRDRDNAAGLKFDGSAELRENLLTIEGGPEMVGFISGSADIFEARGASSDDYIVGSSVGSRFLWPKTTTVSSINAFLRYRAGEVYEDRIGVLSAIEFRTESSFFPLLSASYYNVNVRENDAQDGNLIGLSFGVSKSLFGDANVGSFISLQHFDADQSYESYDSVGLSFLGREDLGYGFGVALSADIRFTEYGAKAPLFTEKRRENRISADLELVKNDIFLFGKFSPFTRIGFTHNESSINIFTYDEFRFLVGVKNAF